MTESATTPALVAAVEAVLGTKVLSLRYLPSPSAAAAALGARASHGAEDAETKREQ